MRAASRLAGITPEESEAHDRWTRADTAAALAKLRKFGFTAAGWLGLILALAVLAITIRLLVDWSGNVINDARRLDGIVTGAIQNGLVALASVAGTLIFKGSARR